MRLSSIILTLFSLAFFSCSSDQDENNTKNSEESSVQEISSWVADLNEMSDEEYPNDPSRPLRHSEFATSQYNDILLEKTDNGNFNITLNPSSERDTIVLDDIDLMESIPTICKNVKDDEYISEIAIVNQEWNRHQIRFDPQNFSVSGENSKNVVRVDIARNCLNSYLWEVCLYAKEGKDTKPFYHGWFDFPHDLYQELFEERNHVAFDKYASELEEWIQPESKVIELENLRKVKEETEIKFQSLSHQDYPLEGERKKKHVNIIYPKNTTKMADFLTDSTQFATFSPPGYYDMSDPRSTELSRLAYLQVVQYRILENDLVEFEFRFNLGDENETNFIVSGLDLNEFPKLSPDKANDGWMNSMGFANHSFYETYEEALTKSSLSSSYFALLADEDYKWLDSHEVGIDGPLFHWDERDPYILHFWILSFERHAFVGHYILNMDRWVDGEVPTVINL